MKNMGKKLLVIGLALVLTITMTVPVFASGAPQPVRDAKNSVVRVLNHYTDGYYEGASSGTGFAVGTEDKMYIVTNYHVVEDAEELFVLYDTGKYVEATVYEQSESRDLAVLEIKGDIPDLVPMVLQTSENIETGMAVYALGYPGAADILASGLDAYNADSFEDLLNTIIADKNSMTLTNGIISAIVESSLVGDGSRKVQLIQTNAAINHGNSGGPLLDEEGNVVGINTLGLSSLGAESVNGSVHVAELEKILKNAHIEYLEPVIEEEVVVVKPNYTPLIVMLVLVAMLIAAVVIILVVVRRNRAKSGGIEGGTSFGEFERSGKVLGEAAVCEMVKAFLNEVIPLERTVDINLILSPDNIAVGDTQIVLKSKKPTKRGATTLEIYPGYSAPENYKNRASTASAVYFIGAMMYRMLTGERPADALTRSDEKQPAFAGGDTLQTIINQAMEPQETSRTATLYQLQEALFYNTNQIMAENAPPQPAWPAQDPWQQQPPMPQQGAWQQPAQPQQSGWQQPEQPQQGGWQQPEWPQQNGWQQPPQGPYGY